MSYGEYIPGFGEAIEAIYLKRSKKMNTTEIIELIKLIISLFGLLDEIFGADKQGAVKAKMQVLKTTFTA